MKKTIPILLSAALLLSACGQAAGTAETTSADAPAAVTETTAQTSAPKTMPGGVDKAETVYAKADADGTVTETTVEAVLKARDGATIEDVAALRDIINKEGDEAYTTGADNALTWENSGNAITYEGKSDAALPVTTRVTYYLNGVETAPADLAGQSGRVRIRFDYTMADASDEFLRELLEHHVSGQLRVAPEHVSDAVLSVMGKPSRAVYDAFCRKFERLNREYGLKQYVVPYLISSHPGSTMKEAVDLAEAVRDMGYMPEQVQDFYPTPSTMSTCMYYTGVDPRTMQPIYVARDPHEKAMQRALIQYRKPENYKLVREALEKAGRRDLIGYTKHCLIRPVPPRPGETSAGGGHGTGKKGGKPHGGGAGKGPKGSKGHGGMSRAQNTAGRNRAAQGRQGANGGGRRN